MKITVKAPRDLKEGEEFEVEVEIAHEAPKPRGQLAGLSLTDMSIPQLKIEAINAGSVLYKAKQRNASAETIAKNQERVDAVKAELLKRGVQPGARTATATAAPASDTPSVAAAVAGIDNSETVYNPEVAAEV